MYVSGLKWAGGSVSACKLLTCGYDGSVRQLDVSTGQFDDVAAGAAGPDTEWSAMDVSADGNTVYLAGEHAAIVSSSSCCRWFCFQRVKDNSRSRSRRSDVGGGGGGSSEPRLWPSATLGRPC